MHKMYYNIAKTQAFPLVIRVSSKPRCFKQFHTQKTQSLPIGFHPKPLLNPVRVEFTTLSHRFDPKSHKAFNFVRPTKAFAGFQHKSMEMGNTTRTRSASSGFKFRSAVYCCYTLRARSFSSSYSPRVGKGNGVVRAGNGVVRAGNGVVRAGNSLPWLNSSKVKEAKGLEKGASSKSSRSSRGESVKRLEKVSSSSSWGELVKGSEKGAVVHLSWEESAKTVEQGAAVKNSRSSWEDLAETVSGKNSSSYMVGNKESRNKMVGAVKDSENGIDYNERDVSVEKDEEGEEELEAIDDPRWDNIKNRFRGMLGADGRAEKPELQRWNKQENWGRKTWKEATESTVPKIVGEGVYGVGPVLAALTSGRREFYALYVQEGLDFSSNNRKKKDKKGFEKVLRMAQNIGLNLKEVSKHDLNMVVDNRPHQGLVLDASPLEMVKIKELDPVSPEEEKGSLWVALDEVTDPQNLGAIIRSAYFFGASGVVLCAKNSAPLSGVVSKASAGSLELMELRYCKNMMQFLVASAENGWRVLGGSVSSKAVPLNEILPGEPTILVLGSEGTGLRALVERSCTQLVWIPGNIPVDVAAVGGGDVEAEETNLECSSKEFRSFLAVESLNVSVAAGVLLHHLIGNNQRYDCHVGDKSTDVLE